MILITQIVLLFAMLAFGAKVVDLAHVREGATNMSDVQQPPAGQDVDSLRQYLSR
jgi:hypothetical protein